MKLWLDIQTGNTELIESTWIELHLYLNESVFKWNHYLDSESFRFHCMNLENEVELN